VALRWRATAAALLCALHLAIFVPTIGDWSSILVNDFAPQAKAIKRGEHPYRDQRIEYPPLSIPVLVAPIYVGDSTQDFVDGFEWEMLAFDVGIVVLISFGLPGDLRQVGSALGVYTVGVVVLSGVVLDPSMIDTAPLALSRFDLVPALLVLAAVFARDRARSATWSVLLSLGTAVKAFPLLLSPALLRGERHLWRVLVAAAIPLAVCAVAVLAIGDQFGSAISYHTDRALQVEALAASPFEVAHLLGSHAAPVGGHGGYELAAPGVGFARWLSVALGAACYLLVVWAGWGSRASNLRLVTGLLAILVVFSPVLSPQFLLWILPLSACAFGLGAENAVLLLAIVLTQVALQHYDKAIGEFGSAFVWPVTVRNLALLVFTWMVCAQIVRGRLNRAAASEREGKSKRAGSPKPARSLASDLTRRAALSSAAATHPGSG
jgi:glycosyl transferase family 87